jgi:hypothetical protein
MNYWCYPLNCNILDDAKNVQLAPLRFIAGLILRDGIFVTCNWDCRSVTGDILVDRYTRAEEPIWYSFSYEGGSRTRVIASKV